MRLVLLQVRVATVHRSTQNTLHYIQVTGSYECRDGLRGGGTGPVGAGHPSLYIGDRIFEVKHE